MFSCKELINKIPETFKQPIVIVSVILITFISIYLGGWYANGVLGTHFDLVALLNLVKTIPDFIMLWLAKFGIHSIFNTPLGSDGKEENK